jgi:hypothetical protein
MPMTKDAKRDYQREYMRNQRAGKKTTQDNGNEHLIEELEWKPIPGYAGYSASACGQILSEEREKIRSNGRRHRTPARVLKRSLDSKGYLQVGLYADSIKDTQLVHRLVYRTWVGELEGRELDHINSDKTDNRLENLQAVTRTEHANLTLDRIKKEAYESGYEAGMEEGWENGYSEGRGGC